ncbi:MAG: D-glycero-beta-D-manno-heptose 1-phosphate adenylyltransferase [Candidatus Latescibacterota bacterium]
MRQHIASILHNMKSASVAVVGDVMLDEYIIGDSDRISPEAPEPIITERERRSVPGGAANVAVNIATLGARVCLFSIAGDDSEGDTLCRALAARGVDACGLLIANGRPTTRKTRLIARGNQVLRVDRETTASIDAETEARLAGKILESPADVVIVSDYAKGVVTPGLVERLVRSGKRVIVDPKSVSFAKYAGAFLVTPNLHELHLATGRKDISADTLEAPARTLMAEHGIANLLVTLGAEGMALIEREKPSSRVHTRAREVFDVTGAGDTVIATLAAAVASGAELADACFVANIAAGIVVGKRQTATATPEEIMAYAFGQNASEKIVTRGELASRMEELRRAGLKIVFTNGCFDLLHVGHITYLNEARGLGDALVVGLNTDRSIRALKGPSRPIIPEQERSHVLAALECVSFVTLFDEDTPLELIRAVKPDVLVKGADYTKEQVVGHDIVESWGGKVSLIPLVDNTSTSAIIKRIKELE